MGKLAGGGWFKAGQLTRRATEGYFPMILRQDKEVPDLDVSVNFKPLFCQVDASGGIIFRVKSAGNYYVVRADFLENRF